MSVVARRLREAFGVVLASALVASGVELFVMTVRRAVMHRLVFVSHDYLWMTPAAFVVLTVPVALGVLLLSFLIRRPLTLAALFGLVAGVLTFSLLLPHTVLAWWASALLAVGVGSQVMRAASGENRAIYAWLRRLAVVTAVVAVVGGGGNRLWRLWAETSAVRALPAARADAPNVLLIVLDTVRASNLSVYGYDRPTTPHLQGLAREGTTFNWAISTAPWTLPSHGSLFTGLSAAATRGDWLTPVEAHAPTLADVLGRSGYLTAGFVANVLYTSAESGLARGFQHYDDFRVTRETLLAHSPLTRIDVKTEVQAARSWPERFKALAQTHIAPGGLLPSDIFKPADDVASAFLNWQAQAGTRPFFAFVNFFDAHLPHRPGGDFMRQFARSPSQPIDSYDAAIAWLDDVVGRMLATLAERGVLDNTIVVVTSDHGEQFGEHGLDDHANSLYLPLLHVPLIVRYPPGVPSSMRIGAPVTLKDLPATLLELAGVSSATLPGQSLAGYWRVGARPDSDVVAELARGKNVPATHRNGAGGMVSRLDTRFHYIRSGDGTDELFDYRADPAETVNLAGDAAFSPDLNRLRRGIVP